jgi:UDP-3-O-[3-hydroxymyristoyl] glucosamine N-acyltransferase
MMTDSDDNPTITAAELARRVNGRLTGDGARLIRAVATLDEAGPDAVSWVGRPELLPQLAHSQAGVVIVPEQAAVPAGRTTIQVRDPDMAICEALAALAPPVPLVPPGIDPTARVAEGASVQDACIGPHVFVGPHAVIGPGTQLHAGVYVGAASRLGRDCVLWPGVVVRERTQIGDRVIIHPNATIGADGFGYHQRGGRHQKIPQIGRVVIEDDVEIGAGSCIDRARSGETRIGRGTKIDNLVQIAHNVRIGENCIVVGQCGIAGSTTLGPDVMLGGQVGLTDHLQIGEHVMVAAGSKVFNDLPGGHAYRGDPAIEHVQFSRQMVGLRRLPKLLEQLKALTKRVEQLESAAHDRARS